MIMQANKTVLWSEHQNLNAKFTNFAGFQMPIHYGSQIDEHLAVRQDIGIFDVSHMVVVDITGADAKEFLEYLLANDINKIAINQSLYTCMCNEQGGIVDDLIVYHIAQNFYRVVVNAANKDKDLSWLMTHKANFDVLVTHQSDQAILTVQGPNARKLSCDLLPSNIKLNAEQLKVFENCYDSVSKWFVSRTGYTGEDGFEIIMPNDDAVNIWQSFIKRGAKPCGLGARDTLRLEAGLALYGQDMNEDISPLEAGLTWTVAFNPANRNFIGRDALLKQKEKRQNSEIKSEMIGLILEERGVLRSGQRVNIANSGEGLITSGTFSPSLQCGIAIARVSTNSNLKNNTTCEVFIRDKAYSAKIVKYPFVRFNQPVYKSLISTKI